MTAGAEAAIRERKRRWEDLLRMDGKRAFLHVVHRSEGEPERPRPVPENRQARIEWAWRMYLRGLESVERIADELRRRAGPDAPLRLVDVQSPMDIAALVWDKNTFFPALLEAPEAVRELADKAKRLLTAFLDLWFSRYGRSFVAHFPEYYMPRGLTLSEDEVGSVSPALFDGLFLPELAELSARYGGLGVHCCANARHQWDGLRRIPGLAMLNLVQPAAVYGEAYPYFAATCAQMHGWRQEWDGVRSPEWFPEGAHVVLTSAVDTLPEAQRRAEAFHRLYR